MTAVSGQTPHEETVSQLIELMRSKLGESSLTLDFLAKQSHYSPFHLDRLFRSIAGIPPRAFLSALRMEEAKKRLLAGKHTATEVGQAVGYSSFGTFSSRFAQVVGVPPSRFRSCVEECVAQLRVYHAQRLAPAAEGPKSPEGVQGTVSIPAGFDGFVCAGLFPKPIPLGQPAGCTLLFGEGEFWIPPVPDGSYYVMCAGFPWDATEGELSFPVHCIRGKSDGPVRVSGGTAQKRVDVTLRQPRWFDPPILISVPLLLLSFLEGYLRSQAECAN